jgi:hypothetical protein
MFLSKKFDLLKFFYFLFLLLIILILVSNNVFSNETEEDIITTNIISNDYDENGFNWFFLILVIFAISLVFILFIVLFPNGSGYRKKVLYDDTPDLKSLKKYEKEMLKNPEISKYWKVESNKIYAKERIRAYILDNKSEYTKFQIKEVLVKNGYPLEFIDEIYAEIYG